MFTDRVVMRLVAGKGGNGVIAWRREKYIPKGGPMGGNGGCGGSIVIQADSRLFSLDQYRDRRFAKAEDGVAGGSNRRRGRRGKDFILKVPIGTIVRDASSGETLCDLTEDQQKITLCHGGIGGRGNASFKSATHRAPVKCTPGRVGDEVRAEFELKLIADVGLVGFPNAGKSTLISAVTNKTPRIAPYPFTTLRPNLGYINYDDFSRILLADIPGIIDGASAGRGLGLEFLRHIERTSLLLFVLDASCIDGRHPVEDYRTLRQEIYRYDQSLSARPYLIALNKVDADEALTVVDQFCTIFPEEKEKILLISALEGAGLTHLRDRLRLSRAQWKHDQVDEASDQGDCCTDRPVQFIACPSP